MPQEPHPRRPSDSADETLVGDEVPLLSGGPDDETLAEWLRTMLPKAGEQTQYVRDLARALARYEFREARLRDSAGRKCR